MQPDKIVTFTDKRYNNNNNLNFTSYDIFNNMYNSHTIISFKNNIIPTIEVT
jgi:hypothetical protein